MAPRFRIRTVILTLAGIHGLAGPALAKDLADTFETRPLGTERWDLKDVKPSTRTSFITPGRCSAQAVRVVAEPQDIGDNCPDTPCQRSEVRVAKTYQPKHTDEVWVAFSFRVTGDIPPFGSKRNVVGQFKVPPTSESPFLAQRIDNGVFHITVESGAARRVIATSEGDPDALLQAQAFLGRFNRSNPEVVREITNFAAASQFARSLSPSVNTILSQQFQSLALSATRPPGDEAPELGNAKGNWYLTRLSYVSEITSYIGYADVRITPGPRKLLPDPRKDWVDMVYRIKPGRPDNLFGPRREGEIEVWANGEHVVSVKGALGHQLTQAPENPTMYFKFGVYRDIASYTQGMEFDQFRQSHQPITPVAGCPAPRP